MKSARIAPIDPLGRGVRVPGGSYSAVRHEHRTLGERVKEADVFVMDLISRKPAIPEPPKEPAQVLTAEEIMTKVNAENPQTREVDISQQTCSSWYLI